MAIEMKKEVKWNDRFLLIRSACAGIVFFAIFFTLGESAKPSENYVFEKLPVVTGIYQCCSTGSGKSSESWVGSIYAKCNSTDYFPFVGTRWRDCGHKTELNGRIVEVERVVLPTLLSNDATPLVVKLSASGQIYFEYSNQQIRDQWIRSMHSGAFLLTLMAVLIFHIIQIAFFKNLNK
jgi:hypothetical protein